MWQYYVGFPNLDQERVVFRSRPPELEQNEKIVGGGGTRALNDGGDQAVDSDTCVNGVSIMMASKVLTVTYGTLCMSECPMLHRG